MDESTKTGYPLKKSWIAVAALPLAVICLLCLFGGLLAGGLNWRARSEATAQAGQPTLARTSTLAGLRSTATFTPSATPTRRRPSTSTPTLDLSALLTATSTLDWLTATPPFSVTLVPITSTLTLSASLTLTGTQTAQFPIEPSSTPGPALSSWCVPLNLPYQNAQVLRVLDGVSIEVQIGGVNYIVRYLGIALPDALVDSPAWKAALRRNRELVEGKIVILARDQSFSDADGRLLRYVLSEGVFVNRELVESGFAVTQSVLPDVSCDAVLRQAEEQARLDQRGLWGPTPTPSRTALPPTPTIAVNGDVRISYIKYWGVGWQDPNEFVEIRNAGSWPVQLQGWTLSDLQGRQFIFPSFTLKPGAYCRVYTHKYVPTLCNFSFYHPAGIWDDDGDCAILKDALGNTIDQVCYP